MWQGGIVKVFINNTVFFTNNYSVLTLTSVWIGEREGHPLLVFGVHPLLVFGVHPLLVFGVHPLLGNSNVTPFWGLKPK